MTGKVISIYIASGAAAPMQSLPKAQLVAGRGIIGDRYYSRTGTFSDKEKHRPSQEITLIESEQIDYFNRTTGLDLDYGAPRRNMVTRGINLNNLVGVNFRVGEVTLEGIKLCEPCNHLAKLVAGEVLPLLVHRAGLRARIVTGGIVRLTDTVGIEAARDYIQNN